MDIEKETLSLLEKTSAVQRGHFVLRSGLHSEIYVQCARLGEDLAAIERIAALIRSQIADLTFTTILAPAMGGLVIGQEVARQTGSRYLFVEKENDVLTLRRGFKLAEGERVLVVEDVITRGGRAQEAIDIVRGKGALPVGIASIVDRSKSQVDFGIPYRFLIPVDFPTYEADQLPEHLAAIPVQKPGS